MKIAVLLTCFNRKEKTCTCLRSMYADLKSYNENNQKNEIELIVYLVDDGCTDGTVKAIESEFSKKRINIIKGTGSLFWAGGMRLAWNEAYKHHHEWDFYLLLNDDTELLPGAFYELISTHKYSLEYYHNEGIYSGITCDRLNHNKCTYSGSVWINKFKGTTQLLGTYSTPQMCDMTNANILLVAKHVVNKIGIFSNDYQHGLADYDYSIRARKCNIPVLITAGICGICENDHEEASIKALKIIQMTFSERRKYFNHPLHSSKDYLRFIWKTSPMRWPIVLGGRILNLCFPSLYYKLNGLRLAK